MQIYNMYWCVKSAKCINDKHYNKRQQLPKNFNFLVLTQKEFQGKQYEYNQMIQKRYSRIYLWKSNIMNQLIDEL